MLVAAIALLSISSVLGAPDDGKQLSPEGLRKDLDIIWDAVEQGDPAFDRYHSKHELKRVFEKARARIDAPMTDLDFYRIAAPAVAALGNGHAQLSLSDETRAWVRERAGLLPLGTRYLKNKLYVVRNLSGADISPGAEILSINGRPINQIIRSNMRALSLDGTSKAPRLNNAGGWSLLFDLVRIQGFSGVYELRYRERGEVRTVSVNGRAYADISGEWQEKYPNDSEVAERGEASLAWRNDVAIMRIPHWDHPAEGKPGLSEHYREWFAEIAERQAKALVIDIRNNGGGNEGVATELLSYLLNRPFPYYSCLTMNAKDFPFFEHVADAAEFRAEIPKYVRPSSEPCRRYGALEMTEAAFPNLGMQQPRQPQFAGPVFLLVNGGSFSTSSEFASAFHAQKAGLIIGQETSGGYLGDSSGLEPEVQLPESGMTFNASLIAYHMAVPRRPGAQGGVLPDELIRYEIDDVLAGRDLEMERATERAAQAAH